jgi:predicted GNAT family acetyltransferase
MAASHPLDRPVWNALTSRQSDLARGGERAMRFDPEYCIFGACADDSPESLAALAELVSAEGELWSVEAEEMPIPSGVTVARTGLLQQMVAAAITPATASFTIVPLTEDDAPEMRALARLTEPGPFFERTHRLGDFIGVKEDGRLIAMAGERMKLPGHTEVSGVCTHPDHRGRGYAGNLMRVVAKRILARGEIAFLHVYASNEGAIALYETLGFSRRCPIIATILTREVPQSGRDLSPGAQRS